MPFLEGLLISTRNLISDIGRREGVGSDAKDDDGLSPIHEGLGEDKEAEAAPQTIEQLETAISRTKAKFQEVKIAGRQAMADQRKEIRTLKAGMNQWEVKLKKRQRAAYDVPYDHYGEYMRRESPEEALEATEEDDDLSPPAAHQSNSDPTAAPTMSESMEKRLSKMLEAQVLKHLHLLMVAEQQLHIQSNIWNDIVLTLHEKPGSLDQDFMGAKLRILTEISTSEKTKTQLEKQGEAQVRKQVLSMCKLKREVAQEVKKKTSQLEDKVFKNGEEETATMQLIRSLSSDTFDSADLGPIEEAKTASPVDARPKISLSRQTSSLKLRLAREKAAARLAESKQRFTSTSSISINSDLISLDSISEHNERSGIPVETKLDDDDDNKRLSPSGVNEFPSPVV
ncbi:unnamed protein product [Cylindrotheca closterium]|uniref:Uncharacterized protein n=1 Tax=Cylindrotheca closterium TaxID=2856 RepID=A0AAD2FN07_9STRA|nr:unnamed protein product [Cylindrotheca closterium]